MAAKRTQNLLECEPGAGRWSNEPTPLEIAEGAAWLRFQCDPAQREAHARAWNALSRSRGYRLGSLRCRACGVFAIGRQRGQACGHCGEVLAGIENRAACQ